MRKTGPSSMMSPSLGFSLERVNRSTIRYSSARHQIDIPVTVGKGLTLDLTEAISQKTPAKLSAAEIAQIQDHIQQGLNFLWIRSEIR
jgi:hypothetical protein